MAIPTPKTTTTTSHTSSTKIRFPIPVSIHDLEREPYNLLPYPNDFEDDNDEETRIQSFQKLVQCIEQGNRCLNGHGSDGTLMMNLFLPSNNNDDDDDDDDLDGEEEPWMDETRIQALYTLVRYVLMIVDVIPHPPRQNS